MTFVTRFLFAVLVLGVMCVPGYSSVAGAAPAADRFLELHGTYVQPPIAITDIHLTGSTTTQFQAEGGTTWHGDLDGQTSFVMHGILNIETFAVSGVNEETFTGSVSGIGTGHLVLREHFEVTASGDLTLDAQVVDGDGELANVRGHMHFAGTSDPTGAGAGTYTATLNVAA